MKLMLGLMLRAMLRLMLKLMLGLMLRTMLRLIMGLMLRLIIRAMMRARARTRARTRTRTRTRTRIALPAALLFLLLFGQPSLVWESQAQHAPAFERELVTLRGVDMRGYFVQGGLALGTATDVKSMTLDEREVLLDAAGRFIIGFGRNEKSTVALTVVYGDGDFSTNSLSIKKRDYDIQRIDGLPPKQVTPPAELLARIKRENSQIGATRRLVGDWSDFASAWIWPARGRLSGVYGSQRILNGKPRRPHYGTDIAAAVGTAVIAPAGGLVRLAERDIYYSGGTIIIDHGHGLQSAFLHMSSVDVSAGDFVKRGDTIGKIGATGRVTGAHLDWRVNWYNKRVDAQFLLPPAIIEAPQ